MTAEIAVMNKTGVALAADSVVTIRTGLQPKYFNSVNKLFALSYSWPVGIMIYGNAEFMGIPWETLIKEYRKTFKKEMDDLEDYSIDFINYLTTNEKFSKKIMATYFAKYIQHILFEIKESYDKEIESLEKSNKLSQYDKKKLYAKYVKIYFEYLDMFKEESIFNKRMLVKHIINNRPFIDSNIKDVNQKIKMFKYT